MVRYKHLQNLIRDNTTTAAPSSNATEEGIKALRLASLRRTGLLDSRPEPEFDRVTRLAVSLLGTPVVLVAFVDEQREVFKSAVGLCEPWATQREAPLSHSFCQHVVAADAPLVIEDARKHPLVHDNPAIREMGVIAYLGVPIHAPDRPAIGALCAIDDKPRNWTEKDIDLMRDLAAFVATEITSRWRLEESQYLSDRCLHFMNSSPAATYVFDIIEERITFISRGNAALAGRTPEDIIEQGAAFVSKTMHIEDQRRFPDHIERLRRLADEESAIFEYRMIQPDGSWRWFLSRDAVFSREQSGAVRQIIGTAIDITDRKQAEEALRESEERLELALRGAELGTWNWNMQTNEVIYNRRWAEMLGYAPEEVEPHLSTWERLVHLEDKPRVLAAIEAHAKGHTPLFSLEHRLRAKDGSWKWILTSGKAIARDYEGRPTGVAGIHLDITARKEAEETLHEIGRRKDEFFAMLGHELRNPLAAIRHALELCNSDEKHETFLWAKGVLERQSTHLSRLVDDLLDVSRIARGKIELRKRQVDLATVLDEAVEATRPLILERRHKLTISYEHNVLWVDGDPSRLEQIIANLLNNAAKYTQPEGSIWLEARRPKEGEEGSAQDEILISVRDTGAGIALEKIDHMFELFVQGERSLARGEGGLGLGLSIVRTLTELHGGYVTAQSEGLGLGSTFVVHLPAAPAPESPELRERTSGSALTIPHRVLVVDDHTDVAQALARLLKRQGHTVEIANDGIVACEKAHTFAPDVVLLDIGLPGMNGYDVARHLRQHQCCFDALIIALTGYGQEADRRRALEAGFDDHLVKPVDFDRLKHLIEEMD